jgi:hypothetical protein
MQRAEWPLTAIRAAKRRLQLLYPKLPVCPTLAFELPVRHHLDQLRKLIIRQVGARLLDATSYVVADSRPVHSLQTRVRDFDISFSLRSQHSAPTTRTVRLRTIGAI